jgi:hypothetical protein
MTAAIPKWITVEAAREITGHKSNVVFSDWARRWNAKHPDALILRTHGFVEQHSLIAARRVEARDFDQSERVRDALSALHKRGARVVTMRRMRA